MKNFILSLACVATLFAFETSTPTASAAPLIRGRAYSRGFYRGYNNGYARSYYGGGYYGGYRPYSAYRYNYSPYGYNYSYNYAAPSVYPYGGYSPYYYGY